MSDKKHYVNYRDLHVDFTNYPLYPGMPGGDLDFSCISDSDCVAVPGGDPCSLNCAAACKTTVVNARVAARYVSDLADRAGADWQMKVTGCAHCPCMTQPFCSNGRCCESCGGCIGH